MNDVTSPAIVELPTEIEEWGPERYFNRELSWLQFNRRVLEEAGNPSHPLLEKLRFLSISASNLDEFHMVRVAGIRAQIVAGVETISQDGHSPAEQLAKVNEEVAALSRDQQKRWMILEKELSAAGIHLIEAEELNPDERAWLDNEFLNQMFPVLTPIAVDPAHPFPFMPTLGFTLGLELVNSDDGSKMHAVMPIPHQLARFVRLPEFPQRGKKKKQPSGRDIRFIRIETIIGMYISRLFPGYTARSQGAFRILRDSDIEIEEEAEDLVRYFETALKRRRRGSVIRIEIESTMPASSFTILPA